MSDKPTDAELREVLARLTRQARHMTKAELTVLGEYKPTQASATAIAETIRRVRNPFADYNAEKTEQKERLYARILALHAQGLSHKEIARALSQQDGTQISTKTVQRALNPKDAPCTISVVQVAPRSAMQPAPAGAPNQANCSMSLS
jgi:DNA-binding NarL/FixJ family response regulator